MYRRVSLAQLSRFAATRSETQLQASADFITSDVGLPGRGKASAEWALKAVHLNGWDKLGLAWNQRVDEVRDLRGKTSDIEGFAAGLSKVQEGLEADIRGFTFDQKAAYEKQGADAANLHNSEAQDVLRHTYHDLVAWRTIIGQHCTVVAQTLARDPVSSDSHGLGATVARNPLHEIISCAVEDSRAVCVEKFGVAPEVEVVVHSDTHVVCLGARVHYCVLELLKNSFRGMMDRYGSLEVDLAPAVQIAISSDASHAGILITDVGGGLPPGTSQATLNRFFYSTAPQMAPTYTYSRNFGAVFDGLGFGVPMVQLHARMMGGGLDIMSLPGHGTTALITIDKHGTAEW